jgi:hypothetical protein
MINKKFNQYYETLKSITNEDYATSAVIETQMFVDYWFLLNIEDILDSTFIKHPHNSKIFIGYEENLKAEKMIRGFIYLFKYYILNSKSLGKFTFDPFDDVYEALHIELKKVFNKTMHAYFKSIKWNTMKYYLTAKFDDIYKKINSMISENTNMMTWLDKMTIEPSNIYDVSNINENTLTIHYSEHKHLIRFVEYCWGEKITPEMINNMINTYYSHTQLFNFNKIKYQ